MEIEELVSSQSCTAGGIVRATFVEMMSAADSGVKCITRHGRNVPR